MENTIDTHIVFNQPPAGHMTKKHPQQSLEVFKVMRTNTRQHSENCTRFLYIDKFDDEFVSLS